jgi:hypothetical protein
MVTENKGTGGINDISRDGRRAIVSRLFNRGNNNLYLIEGCANKSSLITMV